MGGLWLILTAIAVLVLWWVLRRAGGRASAGWAGGRSRVAPGPPLSAPATTPVEVLDLRLARGEVDLDTYRALRQELALTTPAGQPNTIPPD